MARERVIGARIPEELYRRLEAIASELGTSMSEIVRSALLMYVLEKCDRVAKHGG